MIEMGYEREAIITSVTNRAYDEIYATYMLLGTKEPDVSKLFELFHMRENFEGLKFKSLNPASDSRWWAAR